MRRSRAPWLVRAACVGAMVFAVTGCGPTPKLDFIQARPENALAYPGATLLSTKTYPEDSLFGGGASIDREFISGASTDDIIAWYRTELAKRNWSGGASADSGTDSYAIIADWSYPGLLLDLEFHVPANGTLRYRMHISSTPDYDVAAQVQTLREIPEETLAPPGAQKQGTGEFWETSPQAEAGGRRLRVYRLYQLDSAASSDLEAFYDSELAARGWKSVPPAGAKRDPVPPKGEWQKGTVTARLFIPGEVQRTYEFALDQTIDSAGSPVAP
ncbi:MAG: hypothetical protein ACXWNI_07330 [Candidatus Limnocylindrales bacterium]